MSDHETSDAVRPGHRRRSRLDDWRSPPGTPRARLRLGLILAALVVLLDQAVKQWALARLFYPPDRIEVLPFFNLVPVWNRGVSFGLLANDSPWGPWLLGGFALAVSAVMVVWMARAGSRFLVVGLGLVVGGALGNAGDRALHGAVVDYIDLHYAGWHWPAFNIADTAITIGVVFILLDAVFAGPDAAAKDGSGRKKGK